MAPGPVFIHAGHCEAYAGNGFPDTLRLLPLAFEARGSESRVLALATRGAGSAEGQIHQMFDAPEVSWLQLRHAEAGCFIARVDRAP